MTDDNSSLLRAVELATEGVGKGGGPFGAVIVKDGEIISESYNRVVPDMDPTAHAEILAIRNAAVVLGSFNLKGCVLYTSCEPCPMCLGAIYWAGIEKVVYACDRNDAEEAGFSDKFIYDEIARDPSERHISFIRLNVKGAEKSFRKWDELEDKIPY